MKVLLCLAEEDKAHVSVYERQFYKFLMQYTKPPTDFQEAVKAYYAGLDWSQYGLSGLDCDILHQTFSVFWHETMKGEGENEPH